MNTEILSVKNRQNASVKRFNRPVRIDVLLLLYWEQLLEKRLSELNREIFK
ncbi:hypothetical protein [Lonepinella koalarum]